MSLHAREHESVGFVDELEEVLGLGLEAQATVDERALGELDELVANRRGRTIMVRNRLLKACVRASNRTRSGHSQRPDRLDRTGLRLRCRDPVPAEDRPGDLFSIETVGLAVHVTRLAVGLVHLDDFLARIDQESGQRGTEDPVLSTPIAETCRGSASRRAAPVAPSRVQGTRRWPSILAVVVDHRGVMRPLVGVDSADDIRRSDLSCSMCSR